MAAVQRTPTPIDPRSRMAFIESMEEELKRVQEHLGKRQWKQRTANSQQTTNKKQVPGGAYHTLARSNPATRRRLWDRGGHGGEHDEDSDEVFARVNSAQDLVQHRRRSSTPGTVSSCSSKSPASSPEPIRVKSPRRLPTGGTRGGMGLEPTLSSPIRGLTSSPINRGDSPIARSYPYKTDPFFRDDMKLNIEIPPTSSSSCDLTTPLTVKEMAYAFRDSIFQRESSYDAGEEEEEEEDERRIVTTITTDDKTEQEMRQDVMPSALDDLFTSVAELNSQSSDVATPTSIKPKIDLNLSTDEEEEGEEKSSLTKSDIINRRTSSNDSPSNFLLKRKERTLVGGGATNGKGSYHHHHQNSPFQRSPHFTEQLRRMKELKAEKEKSDRQLSQVIEQLQEQLREKEKDIDSLQTQHLMELKVREERIKKLTRQNARLEREKWDLLKRARETAERSVNLRTKLDLQDASMRSLQTEMDRTNDEMSAVKSANNSLRGLVRELKTKKQGMVDKGVQVNESSSPTLFRIAIETSPSYAHNQEIGESDSGNASGGGGGELNISEEWGERLSIASSQFDGREATPTNSFLERQGRERRSMKNLLKFKFRRSSSTGKHHSTSNLSKVNTSSLDNLQLSDHSPPTLSSSHHSTSGLTVRRSHSPNNIQTYSTASLQDVAGIDSRQILKEFESVPLPQWNTRALVAWIDTVVGMPQYISTIRQHVTSGYALLALTNSDMEKRLSITHPLHRRRLRLAIEEFRTPTNLSYTEAINIDHNWVAYTWAVDCGLPHLSSLLYNGMVNGHVLNSLSRDDLKKYFKMNKKVEQLSFLSGVELLRMHEFNREHIQLHRETTDNPLYWNNSGVAEWLKKINLEEYSGYVIGSGVHGSLLFLERGYFTSEQLANVIHIPPKSPLRKHLATQLAKLFSSDDINSLPDEDPYTQDQLSELTPEVLPLSPTSPPPTGLFSSEHSPHPARRLLAVNSSNPNLTDESLLPPPPPPLSSPSSSFDRTSTGRRSLRESMLRAIQLPPQDNNTSHRPPRPVSQLVSTTTV